jgi:hypothetical protein
MTISIFVYRPLFWGTINIYACRKVLFPAEVFLSAKFFIMAADCLPGNLIFVSCDLYIFSLSILFRRIMQTAIFFPFDLNCLVDLFLCLSFFYPTSFIFLSNSLMSVDVFFFGPRPLILLLWTYFFNSLLCLCLSNTLPDYGPRFIRQPTPLWVYSSYLLSFHL